MTQLIVIVGLHWFDKKNGNSYFKTHIVVHGSQSTVEHVLPFQPGYGDHYVDEAARWLDEQGFTKREKYANGMTEPLWRYCETVGIELVRMSYYVSTKEQIT